MVHPEKDRSTSSEIMTKTYKSTQIIPPMPIWESAPKFLFGRLEHGSQSDAMYTPCVTAHKDQTSNKMKNDLVLMNMPSESNKSISISRSSQFAIFVANPAPLRFCSWVSEAAQPMASLRASLVLTELRHPVFASITEMPKEPFFSVQLQVFVFLIRAVWVPARLALIRGFC